MTAGQENKMVQRKNSLLLLSELIDWMEMRLNTVDSVARIHKTETINVSLSGE